MTDQNQFADPAADVLRAEPTIDDNQRASLHDAFYSKNSAELEQHLQSLDVHPDLKQQLFKAKKALEPAPSPKDKLAVVGSAMTSIDPQTLALMEAHPTVFKTLAAALLPPDKGSESSSGGTAASPKGKGSSKAKKPATIAPDVPATPSGHALVQASDGGLHHLPHANVEKARAIDPGLQVLHVEP